MFPEMLTRLLKFCKARRIHTAVDTSGFATWDVFEKILPYTDLFLYDIKTCSSSLHEALTGVPNTLIWENLERLCKEGATINLRVPLIEGCNALTEEVSCIAERCSRLGIKKVNLLPYHDMGKYKYTKLGRDYDGNSMSTPSKEKMDEFKRIFESYAFTDIKIGG